MGKKYKSDDLLDSCLETCEISCSKCSATGTEHGVDVYLGSEIFFEKGWRATPINTFCPKCVKKHLKL